MKLSDNNVMLDLEAMDTSSDAAITAIGAVRFNEHGPTATFYKPVSLESSVRSGLTMNPATVLWWMRQEPEAQEHLLGQTGSLKRVLREFARWLGNNAEVWGNGASLRCTQNLRTMGMIQIGSSLKSLPEMTNTGVLMNPQTPSTVCVGR